jgi:hypothetical protein
MARVLNKSKDKIPADAVYVGRPSKWGNPHVIGRDGTREEVVRLYALSLTTKHIAMIKHELKGKDLVCWCAPLPCHADMLLEIANAD